MALMDFKECGKQVSDQAASCPNCDAPTGSEKPTGLSVTKIMVTILLLFVGVFIWAVYATPQAGLGLPNQRPAEEAKYVHRSDVLTSGVVNVMPHQLQWIGLIADMNTMRDVRLTGRFVASGGTDSAIEAFVFDQDNYINWENSHDAQPLYQSGEVTVGDIDLPLNLGGRYYVVFSGKHNFTQRIVQTDVKLDYEKRIN